ncbi:hypothetical protein CHUAL_000890 [Chamberlinius hualienensis]
MTTTNKTVFVTVGTTSFDKLISTIDSLNIKEVLKRRGFTDIVCQIGQGQYIPKNSSDIDIKVNYYRIKPSIKEDIEKADFVICHAGAGSVLETLGAGKPCIVVINEDLMGNHQVELAKKLSEENYLFFSTCRLLNSTLNEANFASLKQFPKGNPQLFADYLNQIF